MSVVHRISQSYCTNTLFLYYSVTTFLVGFLNYSEKNAKFLAVMDFANDHAVNGYFEETENLHSFLAVLIECKPLSERPNLGS